MVLGSFRGDAIRNITGGIQFRSYAATPSNIVTTYPDMYNSGAFSYTEEGGDTFGNTLLSQSNSGSKKNSLITFNAGKQVPTAAENRPKSTSLNYYIYVY